MELPVAEDLLRNTEDLAIVIGDVLDVTSGNNSNSSVTITRDNIGMPLFTTYLIYKLQGHKAIHKIC